jgi:exodeoxyribonuclease V gamma subunit
LLRVIYSNRTEELLRALVEEVSASGPSSLRDPPRLVASSQSLKSYLERGIASPLGIATSVESQAPENLLTALTGAPARESVLLDRVLAVLFDEANLTHPELALVRDWVYAAGDGAAVTDRRRVQLAQKLARLFSRYELFRPELLECWRAGLHLDDPALRDVERWQRRLWLEIESSGREIPPPDGPPLPAVHLFGFSTIARSTIVGLARIGEESDVFFYTLNPCQELWEATASPAPVSRGPRRYERRASDFGPAEVFSTEDPFRLSNPGETLPLRLWGKPGRENLRLLNALTGCELKGRMRQEEGDTLLHRLQQDIVSRKPERGPAARAHGIDSDESVVFLECGSPRRELEVIASEIRSLLSDSAARDGEPPLRFEDIAVRIAPSEAARYSPLVASVFREASGIPHRMVDIPLERESLLLDAAQELLRIPLGPLTVSSLVRFVTHPAVVAAFPGSDAFEWKRYGEAVGEGRVDGVDWDGGLNRLATGVFLDSRLPPPSSTAVAGLADFGALLRSLLADARDASRASMTLPAWMDVLGALLSSYLEPRSEADERALKRCFEAVSDLAAMDLSGRKVRYGVAHELVRSRIRGLSDDGPCRGTGVVVSPLLPRRPIPFRVVFVAGLSAPRFPSRESTDQLDLRRAIRRAGDVSPREEDRYAFLETLLSARERIYLSWVSRDPAQLEPVPPSSIIEELIETIARGYVSEERLSFRRHPADRSEDPRARSAFPAASRESRARALGEHLRSHLSTDRLPPLTELAPLPDAVARSLAWPRPREEPSPAVAAPIVVDLAALRAFLECPLQGSVGFHLRLGGDETDETATNAALLDALCEGGTAEAYEQAARRHHVENPRLRRRHLHVLALCRSALRDVANGASPRLTLVPEASSLVLHVSNRRVEILRRKEVRLERPRGVLQLSSRNPERFHPQRESLRGFLDHVFASARESGAGEPYTVVAINAPARGEARTSLVRFAPIDAEVARRYLEEVTSDLLTGVHEYLLPCEAVFGSIDPAKLDRTSSARGPVPHPEDYRRLMEPEREMIVQRRYGLYFQALLPSGETT